MLGQVSPPRKATRSHTVDVDGPVHYVDMGGPAGGPLLIGVHGLGGSHLNWSAIAGRLTRRSRFVALDLVGHGLTPLENRSADIEGHRRLLSGFMRAVSGSPAILIGNSMGGLVAALQAATEPETVAGMILIDPALPTARLGLVHPRVIANFVLCAVPGVGERRRSRVSIVSSTSAASTAPASRSAWSRLMWSSPGGSTGRVAISPTSARPGHCPC